MQPLTLRQRFSPSRFLRGLGPENGPVQLDRSRIFILPSSTGLLFAAVLLVMLLGAINSVSYTHLTLPTTSALCRSRWSPYH